MCVNQRRLHLWLLAPSVVGDDDVSDGSVMLILFYSRVVQIYLLLHHLVFHFQVTDALVHFTPDGFELAQVLLALCIRHRVTWLQYESVVAVGV